MLSHGKRPRELHWYHAGPMLFGDWGTSRLYVLGLAFFYTGHASLWFMGAMSILLVWVGWAYMIICRLFPDGGGVYTSARERAPWLGVVGALLLCADYIVTAALSALDAFHYLDLPYPQWFAAIAILLIGIINFFGPAKAGTLALIVALMTIMLSLVIGAASIPYLSQATITAAEGSLTTWWPQFTMLILAISGVEAIANMTGIMVRPVEKTSRNSIWPVLAEIVILNLVLTVAMQAIPIKFLVETAKTKANSTVPTEVKHALQAEGGSGAALADTELEAIARRAHKEDMLRVIAHYYVGERFSRYASLVFALLLMSAVNSAITGLVSVQYMMSRDNELPEQFAGLNRWGMPLVPLLLSTVIPVITVLSFPDVTQLAHLYAIGIVGAVSVNLGTCSTNFKLKILPWERGLMMALAAFMIAIWITIAYDKHDALAFAGAILGMGLLGRYVAHHHEEIAGYVGQRHQQLARWIIKTPAQPQALLDQGIPQAEGPTYTPAYKAKTRILVATRGNPKLLKFALEQAKFRQAELLVLYVKYIAVPTLGTAGKVTESDKARDGEAQNAFSQARQLAAEVGVPIITLYATAYDVADAILEFGMTYGVELLILGATQRGTLWRTMKGDVIQEVAELLPEPVTLLVHA